jgi:DNA N-6-adenine-methyltransferase (Dam)
VSGHLTDKYCTPKWLADRVGCFDTDPCTNPLAHIIATTKYMLEAGHDGLTLPWHGRVWMNHPYSDPLPWMNKLTYEHAVGRCTESLVLAKLDTSTEWWRVLTSAPCDLWVFKKRINHDIPPEILDEMQRKHDAKGRTGKVSTSNNFCSVLVHHRGAAARLDLHDVAQIWTPG